jgi:MoaA/NifB/PqqE/SkfB family radical SAM enzyme
MDLMWRVADTLGERPRYVIWEMLPARGTADWYPREATDTQAAALPLAFAEGCNLFDQVAGLGTPRPSLLLTGDDPLQRSDLRDLVRYATRQAAAGMSRSAHTSREPFRS